ncbi:MAG TPA: hypothetical protein VH740_19330 [Vicinamibacterales bacterium]
MLHPEAVHLAGEFVAEFFKEILLKQSLSERAEHPRLNFVAPDGKVVVTPPLVARTEASEPVLARHDESGSADAASRQPGEQVLRPLGGTEGTRSPHGVPRLLLS